MSRVQIAKLQRPISFFSSSWLGRGLLLWLLVQLTACSSLPTSFEYQNPIASKEGVVWPAPPEQARFRFVGEVTGEGNLVSPVEEAHNFGVRALRWLVGLVGHNPAPIVLQRPQAVVTDAVGRLYVSDVSRQAVYMFDRAKAELAVWEFAAQELRFMTPIGLTLGPEGSLYVADAGLKVVAQLDGRGEPLTLIGHEMLQHPAGVVWSDEHQRLYVADRGSNSVKVFSAAGELLFEFGSHGETPGLFNGPTYLAWHDSELYVTDTLNSRIQIFAADGAFVRSFGRRGLYLGDLPRPKGVAIGPEGNIYVVESYYDYLLVFSPEGEFLLPIGGSGYGIGQFYLPAGVWVDDAGLVYVADTFNGRIKVFESVEELDVPEAGRSTNSAGVEHAAGS